MMWSLLLELNSSRLVLIFSAALLLLIRSVTKAWSGQKGRRDSARRRSLPPGPETLPLIGNVASLVREIKSGKNTYEIFTNLSDIYGDVFSFWMGGRLMVWINSLPLLKDSLNKDAFSNRPNFGSIKRTVKQKGLIFSEYGDNLRKRKLMTMKAMKNFGLGSRHLEEFIEREFEVAADRLTLDGRDRNHVVDIRTTIQRASANVIASIAFGHRFKADDERANRVFETLCEFFSLNTQKDPAFFMPFFDALPLSVGVARDLERHIAVIYDYIRDEIKEHRANDFDAEHPKDVMDEFIAEVDARGEEDPVMNSDHLLRSILDLFITGTETISTSLSWLCLYVAAEPRVQSRLHRDIDEVVGEDVGAAGRIRKEDLPYLEAVIMETLRLATPVPNGIPHATGSDIEVGGFGIPKNTLVMPNLWKIHHDPLMWTNPFEFRPERHLDDRGSLVVGEAFLPYGIGKRACLGASLATRELFIGALVLLRRFRFSFPAEDPAENPHPADPCPTPSPVSASSLRPKQGLNNSPPTHRIVATPRKARTRSLRGMIEE